jgi:FtsH-binding integral membrane protein
MIKMMRALLESDPGIMIAFIFTAMELWGLIKKAQSYSKKQPGATLKMVILTIGLIIPILILISAPWRGIVYICLNLVSVIALLSFFGLLFIIYTMRKDLADAGI